MYVPRTLNSFVKAASKQFPVVLITGARQVGKTTLVQHAKAASRSYVSLDDPLILRLAKEDPLLFLERYPTPLIIDEIQYAPELLPYIKLEADLKKHQACSG